MVIKRTAQEAIKPTTNAVTLSVLVMSELLIQKSMHVNILFTASFCIQGPCEEENNPPSTFFVLGEEIIFPNQAFREKKITIMSETCLLLDVFTTYTLILLSFQKSSTTNLRLYFQNVLHMNPGFTCTCFKISSVSPFLNITAIFSFLSFFIFPLSCLFIFPSSYPCHLRQAITYFLISLFNWIRLSLHLYGLCHLPISLFNSSFFFIPFIFIYDSDHYSISSGLSSSPISYIDFTYKC